MCKLNKTGYSELMPLMCNMKVALMLVQKLCMTGLPNRSLYKAWENLKA